MGELRDHLDAVVFSNIILEFPYAKILLNRNIMSVIQLLENIIEHNSFRQA